MTPRAREHRFRRLKELGCIACWMDGLPGIGADIHHLNLGGKAGQKRRGDRETIPLCPWHHRGVRLDEMTKIKMTIQYGPSLALESRLFRNVYGADDDVLAKVNDLIRQADELAA